MEICDKFLCVNRKNKECHVPKNVVAFTCKHTNDPCPKARCEYCDVKECEKQYDGRIDRMSMISELVDTLRTLSGLQNKQHNERIINRAADTIESLSAKLAGMERSAEDCGGWIACKNRLPETLEYMEFEPTPYMKRLEIAYMTDMVEYIIGYFDGYKWIDKRNRKIENVIAWKPFLKLTEPYHEP